MCDECEGRHLCLLIYVFAYMRACDICSILTKWLYEMFVCDGSEGRNVCLLNYVSTHMRGCIRCLCATAVREDTCVCSNMCVRICVVVIYVLF